MENNQRQRVMFSLAEIEAAIGLTVSPYKCFQGKCFLSNDWKNKTVSCTPEMYSKIMERNTPDADGFINGIKFIEAK